MFASGLKTTVPASSIYVSNGDVAALDFDKNDFTWDSTYRELDLSAIVPAGTKLVHLAVTHRHSGSANWIKLRKNGYSNIFNNVTFNTRVANVSDMVDCFVEVDSDRKLAYQASVIPTKFDVVVRGWIL